MSLQEQTKHLSPVWARYTNIVADRAEGVTLYGDDGRTYMDFTCGIGVTNTGHCHPRVVAAIREQAGLLLHGQANIIYHKPMLRLVEALRQVVPAGIDSFFFSNSGAEAVEAALKLARHATGRTDVIVFDGSFHGRTSGAMALTTSKGKYRSGYAPLPSGVHVAPYASCFGCAIAKAAGKDRAGMSAAAPHEAGCCGNPLERVEHILHANTTPHDVAAILIEPVLGEGGYVVPPASFLRGLRDICDKYGIMLIADEVQTGFGRTGKFFAMEHYGVTADIIVAAKGIASGLPLSAVMTRKDIMDKWHPGTHGGTYGGNALACAAAVATLDVIIEERLVENSAAMGAVLKGELSELQQADPRIGDVRGMGLMVGVELIDKNGAPDAVLASRTLAACREAGLLLLTCGTYDNVVRFIPPLVVTDEQIHQAVRIFRTALNS
jgi:4-aminobutyrate aminotransferase